MIQSRAQGRGRQADKSKSSEKQLKPSVGQQSWVVLIDRKPLTRHCLALWLQRVWQDCRVREVSSPEDIIGAGEPFTDIDLVVYNMGPVWRTDVASDIDHIIQNLKEVPLVLLSDGEDIDDILEAIERGVRGYITTALAETDAAEAMRFIRSGGTFVPANSLVRSIRHHRPSEEQGRPDPGIFQAERLTRRESEVLALLRQGKPNKIIAHELNISPSTVKVFVRQILLKLHASNRTEVAYLTHKNSDEIKCQGEP